MKAEETARLETPHRPAKDHFVASSCHYAFLACENRELLASYEPLKFFCAGTRKVTETPIGKDCLPFLPIFLRANLLNLGVVYSSEVERLEHEK